MEKSFHGVAGALHSPALGTGIGVLDIRVAGWQECVVPEMCPHGHPRCGGGGLGVEEVFLPVFVRALVAGVAMPGQPAWPLTADCERVWVCD